MSPRSTNRFAGGVLVLALLLSGCAGTPPLVDVSDGTKARAVDASTQRMFARALDAMAKEDWATAEKSLLAVTNAMPELSSPWTNLGIVYLRTGRTAEAASVLGIAVDHDPSDCPPRLVLAELAERARDYQKAREHYLACLEKEPDNRVALVNLGIVQEIYLGDLPDALQRYEHYRDVEPGDEARVAAWIADLSRRVDPQVVSAEGVR